MSTENQPTNSSTNQSTNPITNQWTKFISENPSDSCSIAFIGIGIMGRSMAMNLASSLKPKQLRIYNRTKSKSIELAENLSNSNVIVCDTPRQAVSEANIIISCVGYPRDVENIYLSKDEGFLAHTRPGSLVIDCTTSSPSLAKRIQQEAAKRDILSLDCPVSGGDIGAKNATLTFFIGGLDSNDSNLIQPLEILLSTMGKSFNYFGSVGGSGQNAKLANQIFIASGMMSLVEGILYAEKTGLNPESVLNACSKGAAQSFSLTAYGPRILSGNFGPGFRVDHFLKDMQLALDECERTGLILPGLTQARMFYTMLKSHGDISSYGTQALYLVLKRLNQMEDK